MYRIIKVVDEKMNIWFINWCSNNVFGLIDYRKAVHEFGNIKEIILK